MKLHLVLRVSKSDACLLELHLKLTVGLFILLKGFLEFILFGVQLVNFLLAAIARVLVHLTFILELLEYLLLLSVRKLELVEEFGKLGLFSSALC